MFASALVALSLLAQVPDAPTEAASPTAESPPKAPAIEPAPTPLPLMRWDSYVRCGYLTPTSAVPSGHFRIQCDDPARRCLVTSTRVLGSDGVETNQPLLRANECGWSDASEWAQKAAQGYTFVPAIAEAPPGWVRDERGRVMQVNFDLHRRVYLGASYAPLFARDAAQPVDQVRADFGVAVEFPGENHTLHRIHVLESQLFLGGPSSLMDVALVRYDWSAARPTPALWLTTFIGRPRRFDLALDLGGWFEAMHLEAIRRTQGPAENLLTLAAANLTVDLWHSPDLVSYVRVRLGPALELDTERKFTGLRPQAAVEANLTLDPDGFHHVRASLEGQKLYLDPLVDGRAQNPERLRLAAGYELIVLAINDYPLTVLAEGRGTWRNDLPGVPAGWEWRAGAGLRFSFWAPAKRSARGQGLGRP